jgi:hypothetical protein
VQAQRERYPCCVCNKPFGQVVVRGSIGALAAVQGVNYELLTRGGCLHAGYAYAGRLHGRRIAELGARGVMAAWLLLLRLYGSGLTTCTVSRGRSSKNFPLHIVYVYGTHSETRGTGSNELK